MEKKEDLILKYKMLGYEIVSDDGKGIYVRKKFNHLAFWLLFLLTIVGGIIYLIYHYSKSKMYVKYK